MHKLQLKNHSVIKKKCVEIAVRSQPHRVLVSRIHLMSFMIGSNLLCNIKDLPTTKKGGLLKFTFPSFIFYLQSLIIII